MKLNLLAILFFGSAAFGLHNPQTTYGQAPLATDLSDMDFTNLLHVDFTFTTQAYRDEAVRLLIREANLVASELQLPEQLPITETNLIEDYIRPYRDAAFIKSIGDVSTSNYMYEAEQGNKFSGLMWLGLRTNSPELWSKDYSWPISRLDTNAAYQLATQWLTAVSVDVGALNRDCVLRIQPEMLNGQGTNVVFVPAYSVSWTTNWTEGRWGHGSHSYVLLFLPTKTLIQLEVDDPKYILRPPIVFTNLAKLLSDTNRPKPRESYEKDSF